MTRFVAPVLLADVYIAILSPRDGSLGVAPDGPAAAVMALIGS